MYAFEVEEKLDQCIEWGEVYNSQGVRNVDDANPECYPDYGRSGAPFFIQDDEGRWHMFYEAGKRLNTNIVHAVEVKDGEGGRGWPGRAWSWRTPRSWRMEPPGPCCTSLIRATAWCRRIPRA